MGAEFIFASLPAADITDERYAELEKIVSSATDDEFSLVCDSYGDDVQEARDRIESSLHAYQGGLLQCRDADVYAWPGMTYKVILSGGTSWGDSPTDTFDTLSVLGSFGPVFNKLEEWAKKDYRNAKT